MTLQKSLKWICWVEGSSNSFWIGPGTSNRQLSILPCIFYLYNNNLNPVSYCYITMMKKETTTLGHKNITLTFYYRKGLELQLFEREREREREKDSIDRIFIVIFTTFQPICPSAFFSCFMSNSEAFIESRTAAFIWTTREDCSNSVNYDWVQVLSYSKYSSLLLLVVGIEPATSRWFHLEALSN